MMADEDILSPKFYILAMLMHNWSCRSTPGIRTLDGFPPALPFFGLRMACAERDFLTPEGFLRNLANESIGLTPFPTLFEEEPKLAPKFEDGLT